MSLRRCHMPFVAALVVGGCAAGSPSQSNLQTPTSLAVSPVAATPAIDAGTSGVTVVATPIVCRDPSNCTAEGLETVQSALPLLVSDVPAATASLRKSPSPYARALMAWLTLRSGDEATALKDMATIAHETDNESMIDAKLPPEVQVLTLVRLVMESVALPDGVQPEQVVPCAVFEQNPHAAAVAFAPIWGSGRDVGGSSAKRVCLNRLLKSQLPADQVRRTNETVENIVGALFDYELGPADGTMYASLRMAAADVVVDLLMDPSLQPTDVDTDAGFQTALRAGHGPHPLNRPKLTAFRHSRDVAVPVLASAVCTIANSRGTTTAADVCNRATMAAVHHALLYWLASLTSH